MEEKEYRKYLRTIRKLSVEEIEEYVIRMQDFEKFLETKFNKRLIDNATPHELRAFLNSLDWKNKEKILSYVITLLYYCKTTINQVILDELLKIQSEITGKERYVFELKKFVGTDRNYIKKLKNQGIENIEQMLERASTPKKREKLASETDIPLETIEEYAKLSDLARIAGLKGTRSRLYYDAGLDSLEKIAKWEPNDLRNHFIEFSTSSNYKGAKPPTPKECQNHVKIAKQLPKILEI